MGDLKLNLGSAIKRKRSELGISQEELAERAGLHRTYVSDVERGMRNLSLDNIEKLARALEMSVSGLFERTAGRGTTELIEILIVEDNAQDVELTCRALRKANIANPMRVFADGEEALDFLLGPRALQAGERLPGLILLDLKLPRGNGLEILRRLKMDKRTREIPVVVLTGSTNEEDFAACRQLGASTYIVKPFIFRNFSEIAPLIDMEWVLTPQSSDLASGQ